jgi:hypothetical protein
MMYHPYTQSIINDLASGHVEMGFAVEIMAPSAPVRVHTGVGEVVINSQLYLGLGSLGSISPSKSDGSTSPKDITLSLALIDSSMLALALNEKMVGSQVQIIMFTYGADGQVKSTAVAFAGKITSVSAVTGDENTVSYSCANELEGWQSICSWRYTEDGHLLRYPGDHGLRYVGQSSERTIYWGSKSDAPPFVYGS